MGTVGLRCIAEPPPTAMSAKICASKLTKEYAKIRKEPLPGVVVQPNENNIREWHFCLLGHKDSPYRGGVFHGKLVFPPEYPMKPPAIYMLTPNGRFDINVRICTSYSDYHPESWNPAWSCATIILGMQSFMLEDSPSAGCISRSEAVRRNLAASSISFNQGNSVYRKNFDAEIMEEMLEEAAKQLSAEERETAGQVAGDSGLGNPELAGEHMSCMMVIGLVVGTLCLFAFLN